MSDPKPVLVTGAAGLVGRQLLRRLAQQGRAVLACDRVASREGSTAITACELNDVHGLHGLARHGIDAVIHCGAFSGPMVARDQPHAMVQVNIVGTANVLELARIHGARRFVYCSSTSAYGTVDDGPVPVTEDRRLTPVSLYGASKVASEYIASAYAQQYGLSAVSIRLSWVYGPGRTTDCFIRQAIEDAQAGRPTRLGFGIDFPRQYVHVEDAAEGLLKALDAPGLPRTSYNITGGKRLTLGEVAQEIRKVFPAAQIQLEAGPDPVDEYQHEFSIEAARRDLGYAPAVSLPSGIRSYADWLEQRGEGRS